MTGHRHIYKFVTTLNTSREKNVCYVLALKGPSCRMHFLVVSSLRDPQQAGKLLFTLKAPNVQCTMSYFMLF